MIDVKNKVIFIRKGGSGMDKESQISKNVQGQLKKGIIKVKKLKTSDKISVELTGNYDAYEIKVEPADHKLVPKIKAMLKYRK